MKEASGENRREHAEKSKTGAQDYKNEIKAGMTLGLTGRGGTESIWKKLNMCMGDFTKQSHCMISDVLRDQWFVQV